MFRISFVFILAISVIELQATTCSSSYASEDLSLELHFQETKPKLGDPFAVCITNRSDKSIRIANPNSPSGHMNITCQYYSESRVLVDKVTPKVSLAKVQRNPMVWYRRFGDSRKCLELKPQESVTTFVWPGMWPWDSPKVEANNQVLMSVSFDAEGMNLTSNAVVIESAPEELVPETKVSTFDLVRKRKSDQVIKRLQANPKIIMEFDRQNILHAAARSNDIATLQYVLKLRKLDVNAKTKSGFTALQLANSLAAIKVMLEAEADVAVDSPDGTAIEIAARKARSRFAGNDRDEWERILRMYLRRSFENTSLRNAVALDAYQTVARHDFQSVAARDLQVAFETAIAIGSVDVCRLLVENNFQKLRDNQFAARHSVFQAVDNTEILKLLIDSGFPHEGVDSVEGSYFGQMPIHFHACAVGNVQSARFLMTADSEFLYTDPVSEETTSLLDVAASSGSTEVADLAYEFLCQGNAGLSEDAANAAIVSSLFHCLRSPDLLHHVMMHYRVIISKQQILQLAESAVFKLMNEYDKGERRRLKAALELLMEAGAESDLVSCVALGDIERVKQLLRKNKDLLRAIDENGGTIIHNRLLLEQPDILEYILSQSESSLVQKPDASGATCLHRACDQDLLESALRIIDYRIDVNKKDSNGRTPLHLACRNCNVSMVRKLLQSGADSEARDNEGTRPFEYAKVSNSALQYRKLHFELVFGGQLKGDSQTSTPTR